jgi:hypothetical protein
LYSQVIISGELNYSDPVIQAQVENLTQTFENTTYISSPLYTESWLRSFVGYVYRNQEYLNVSIDTEDDFIRALKEVSSHQKQQTHLPQVIQLSNTLRIICLKFYF